MTPTLLVAALIAPVLLPFGHLTEGSAYAPAVTRSIPHAVHKQHEPLVNAVIRGQTVKFPSEESCKAFVEQETVPAAGMELECVPLHVSGEAP